MEKSGIPAPAGAVLTLTLMLSLALLLSACGGSSAQQAIQPEPPASSTATADAQSALRLPAGFSAELLPGCELGGGSAGQLSAEVAREADGTVLVELSLSGARGLRAFYARVGYDAADYSPHSAAPTALAGSADSLLSIADTTQPGRVEYGQVQAHTLEGTGFSGSGVIARISFRPGPASATRSLSAAPTSSLSVHELSYNMQNAVVSFHYNCQGDYDQNGLVTVADLTPLGIHLNTEVTDPLSARAHVDGDKNDFVTLADLTPIGANFGRPALGGFAVYRSSNPADYPAEPNGANGAGAEFVGVLPFDTALNAADSATERLLFSFDASEPGGLYLWLRPTDGSELGICSTLLTAGPPVEPVLVDFLIGAGDYNSLAIVEGHPAIAYQRGASRDLYYTRALDPAGEEWSEPLLLDGSGVSNGIDPCLAVINGRPAVSYYFADQSDLRYIRASNATGSAWGSFVAIDSANNSGQWSSMIEVGGRPAISYYNATTFSLSYVRAADSDGTAWGTPVTADATEFNGGYSSLALVNGRPAIAYHQFPFGDDELGLLRYVRANDAQGTSWPASGITVDEQVQFQGLYPQLMVCAGNPAVLHYDQSTGDLRFVRSGDESGVAWPAGIVAAADANVAERFQAALIDGRPAAAFANANELDLRYAMAGDAAGSQWQATRVLDFNQGAGFNPALLELPDGKASVAYGRVDTGLQFLSFEP